MYWNSFFLIKVRKELLHQSSMITQSSSQYLLCYFTVIPLQTFESKILFNFNFKPSAMFSNLALKIQNRTLGITGGWYFIERIFRLFVIFSIQVNSQNISSTIPKFLSKTAWKRYLKYQICTVLSKLQPRTREPVSSIGLYQQG